MVNIVLIAFLILGLTSIIEVSATSPSEYSCMKSHIINGSIDGVLSDYQVKYVVHKGIGISSDENVYLGDRSLSWPDDIRFTDINDNMLSYWIEWSDSSTATVWVKVPSIPGNSGSATINIYYGKSGDQGASSGVDTFLLFDDFDTLNTSKWSFRGGDSGINNGVLTIFATNSTNIGVDSVQTFGYGYALRAMLKTAHFKSSSYNERIGFSYESRDVSGSVAMYCDDEPGYEGKYRNRLNDAITSTSAIQGWTANAYLVQEIQRKSNYAVFTVNDGHQVTLSSDYYPGNAKVIAHARDTNGRVDVDWVLVRKIADNEPTYGAWSEEMSNKSGIWPIPSVGIEGLSAFGLGTILYVLSRRK